MQEFVPAQTERHRKTAARAPPAVLPDSGIRLRCARDGVEELAGGSFQRLGLGVADGLGNSPSVAQPGGGRGRGTGGSSSASAATAALRTPA